MNVLFLDFDGVIRVSERSDAWNIGQPEAYFCIRRQRMLEKFCRDADVQIVISSDWRDFGFLGSVGELIEGLQELVHKDWRTPRTGTRWHEIDQWLDEHPETNRFAILDDISMHFTGAPAAIKDRLILCTNRYGLVPQLMNELHRLLAAS